MKKIRVSKELLINLGSYSNIKIIAEIEGEDWAECWEQLNRQLGEQENLERNLRLPVANRSDEIPF
jgi:hypothetical protein